MLAGKGGVHRGGGGRSERAQQREATASAVTTEQTDGVAGKGDVEPAARVGAAARTGARVGEHLVGSHSGKPRRPHSACDRKSTKPALARTTAPACCAWSRHVAIEFLMDVPGLSGPTPTRRIHWRLGRTSRASKMRDDQ